MVITINTRDQDWEVLIDGARTALLANSTIATALDTAHNPKRIAYEAVEEGITAPYIVLAFPSAVAASNYNEPGINALIDVGIYTDGQSTVLVRQLVQAALKALLVDPWSATGLHIASASMEGQTGAGFRPTTDVLPGGKMRRGRQFTFRVQAYKQ